MSYKQHAESSKNLPVRCAIITLSDSRTPQTDASGKKIAELLHAASLEVVEQMLVKEDPGILQPIIACLIQRDDIDVILTTGGTGISRRDQTIAVIEKWIDQALPGFGELFRQLSYAQIGSGAMLSRAIGGIASGKVIFAMPGSTNAVELAMKKLVLPELRHLVFELRK